MAHLQHGKVLVALSGGADSVALLRLLLDAGCHCHAAHCNFHLRGDESMRDEQFIRQLCRRLDVPLAVKDFDVPAWQHEHGGSIEMACREMRYSWFEQERLRCGCDLIAVAHHANDQVETFFLNLMRGTGIKGLTAMRLLNGNIWRPLLDVSRQELLDYLASIKQDFVIDSTNLANDYNRNRLRNIVIPAINQQFPHAHDNILATIGNLTRDYDLITLLASHLLPNVQHIDIKQLLKLPQPSMLLYHRIRHLGFNHEQCYQAVEAASQGHSGKLFIGNAHTLVVNRYSMAVESLSSRDQSPIEIDLTTDIMSPVHISITRNNSPFSPAICNGKTTVALNSNVLSCRQVRLRHWKKGDRMKPFGMNGSKLLSDLFADLKLDYSAKHEVWILEADGEILWVIGYRASALYPVHAHQQDYLLLTLI